MAKHVDFLVFAPHPDDAELCCGGLLLKARDAGKTVAVIDVTRGEMGTRGTTATRRKEADAASKMLRLAARENLGLPDGHLHDDERLRTALVRALRSYQPRVLLLPHWEDQHPDHAAVGQAGMYAAWLCGAAKYDARSARGVTSDSKPPYRPQYVLHYNNRYGIHANLVIDISAQMDEKVELCRCYSTQFGPNAKERGPQTRLSHNKFFEWLRGMHGYYGYQISTTYGEAYCTKMPLRVENLNAFL